MTIQGTPTDGSDESKTMRDVVWENLDTLADSAESANKLVKNVVREDAESIHQDLIQKMITAIRDHSVEALRKLVEEDAVRFAYTPNIQEALGLMDSED